MFEQMHTGIVFILLYIIGLGTYHAGQVYNKDESDNKIQKFIKVAIVYAVVISSIYFALKMNWHLDK